MLRKLRPASGQRTLRLRQQLGIALLAIGGLLLTPMAAYAQSPSPGSTPSVQSVQPNNGAKPNASPQSPAPAPSAPNTGYVPDLPGSAAGRLRVKVIDGRTRKPLQGAEVVVIETEKRYKTDKDGLTPWIKAPVLRSARYRFLVNELHGQLNLISYKDGYRDSVHMGVRVNEGAVTKTTIWQYKILPGPDTRVEPVLYQEPYHRLWIIQLADRFRRPSQLGEGYERP
ncbi:MAG: hypothetical protein OWT28_10605 [Firmicutes bacterium]|nr:hypothetical protein [Bacillota bacterium]